MIDEILIIILLILANGVFAMSEMALASSRKTRLQKLAEEGNRNAKILIELLEQPEMFISSCQIGITLIGILAGAYGGATIADSLVPWLKEIPYLEKYAGGLALAIVVGSITYLSLVIGELLPKRLALGSPERIALFIAAPMRTFISFAHPVVRLLTFSSNCILRLFGMKTVVEHTVTEDEIKAMIDEGTKSGEIHESEQDMVERVFEFGDLRVAELMTPRMHIEWLDIEESEAEINQKIQEATHSRLLLCEGTLDELLGIVEIKEILLRRMQGKSFDLKELVFEPLYLHENLNALQALELFKKSSTPMGFVLDEYGVMQGILTRADILEAIVGDIASDEDADEPRAIRREDGSFLMDGLLEVEDACEALEIEKFPDEEKGHFHTLGGFLMTHLGKVPTESDHFDWGGFRFEIMDMDGRRIDKVLVSRHVAVAPSPEASASTEASS